MKKIAKNLVVYILSWQVKRLAKKNKFVVVGVAGSIGKTSTKYAIASVLGEELKVKYQAGNYNDIVTVPLIFFGLDEPSLMNPLAWFKTFIKIEKQLSKSYPYDVVVIEIATDGPNQISKFAKYAHCDIAVLTAISLEHMQFFSDLDEVAKEELSITKFSDLLIANSDLSSEDYLSNLPSDLQSYGLKKDADYHISELTLKNGEADFTLLHKSGEPLKLSMKAIAKGEVYSATAAAVIARSLGVSNKSIQAGVSKLQPVNGRMQRLEGIKDSLLIDESYNSSPEAVKEALDSLYRLSSPQKIAVLGNMNELGSFSQKAHEDIGKYCDPKQLELVLTIGKDANSYLAEAAKKNGCKVITFNDPYSLADKLKEVINSKAAVLFKGSQNGVFLEEAIKPLLKNTDDQKKLVRQSAYWLKQKSKSFNKA